MPLRAVISLLLPLTAFAQGWQQWGQNARHTGVVRVTAQRPEEVVGEFVYDKLADQIREDHRGSLVVHYMAPLVDRDDVFIMSRGDSEWVSCRTELRPCGSALWPTMTWGVTKLRKSGGSLQRQWTAMSTWKPAPDNGSGWEPVFHPALSGRHLYVPGGAGMLMKFDRKTGELVDCIQPFEDDDPNRYITSPLTVDRRGAVFYTVMKLDPAQPWTSDVQEAFLVKIDAERNTSKVAFADLISDRPVDGCFQTFSGQALPWPPASDALPPMRPCGSQRPGLNAAPAVGRDGTVYVVSRAHFNSSYGYLVAVNPDLTRLWSASLRDRLNDGCDVLLPPSGTLGGCRAGSLRGVDPATNQAPAGRVEDLSTASPVVAPDGSILYGAYTRYNYQRGHLLRFSSHGEYLGSYDFGWDITPAVYEHDGTWSVILKDNLYGTGSYCDLIGFCGFAEPSYNITSLDRELRREWSYRNTNDQLCQRLEDGSLQCETVPAGFEWCVNMVAVDRNGTVYANSEDGNLYAIDKTGQAIERIFLKAAIGAAYTPLAIGRDGLIYTQNDGTLFVVGEKSASGGA